MVENKVSYRFGNFGNTLIFSVREKRFSNYPKLTINGVRNLNKRMVRAFAKKITDSFVVEAFLKYEYMRYFNDEGAKFNYKSKVVIEVNFGNHELISQLMRQFLTNERSEIGIGRIFMLQCISDGFIETSEHLDQLIKNQCAPDVSIPRHPALYSFPLYQAVVERSLDDLFIKGGLKDFNIPRGFRSSKNMDLLFLSFLSNSNGLTFSEFIEEPIAGNFRADDPHCSGAKVYEWILKYQSKIDMKEFADLTAHEMTIVEMNSLFSGLYSKSSNNSDLGCSGCQVSHDEFNSYLIKGEHLSEVYSILTEASHAGTIANGRSELKSYLCYLMVHRSIEDAKELLRVFPAICDSVKKPRMLFASDYDFFGSLRRENYSMLNEDSKLLSKKMKEILAYFDEEKTMSLEMWATLHDLIGLDD